MKRVSLIILSLCLLGAGFYVTYALAVRQTQIKTPVYQDKSPRFIHDAPEKTLAAMTGKARPGIYYFGYPNCPWCVELLPVFDRELKRQHKQAQVVNTRADNYRSVDNIVLEKFFIKHTFEKRLSVPFIVVIQKDGKVKTHVGTVKGHNAPLASMTREQHSRLEKQLRELITE